MDWKRRKDVVVMETLARDSLLTQQRDGALARVCIWTLEASSPRADRKIYSYQAIFYITAKISSTAAQLLMTDMMWRSQLWCVGCPRCVDRYGWEESLKIAKRKTKFLLKLLKLLTEFHLIWRCQTAGRDNISDPARARLLTQYILVTT